MRRRWRAAVDVADRASVDDAVGAVRRELGPVEILVTSAGISMFEPFLDITLESWNRIIEVNLTGTFHCVQAAIPDMVAAEWGRIVTISSSSAQRGSPRMAHYAASKGGVITLDEDVGPRVRAVRDHGEQHPAVGHRDADAAPGPGDGHLPSNEAMAKTVPLGRLGTGDDIAAACVFLCSDEAGYITGQVLGVNGGSVL